MNSSIPDAYTTPYIIVETFRMRLTRLHFWNELLPSIQTIVAGFGESKERRRISYEKFAQYGQDEGEFNPARIAGLRMAKLVDKNPLHRSVAMWWCVWVEQKNKRWGSLCKRQTPSCPIGRIRAWTKTTNDFINRLEGRYKSPVANSIYPSQQGGFSLIWQDSHWSK